MINNNNNNEGRKKFGEVIYMFMTVMAAMVLQAHMYLSANSWSCMHYIHRAIFMSIKSQESGFKSRSKFPGRF